MNPETLASYSNLSVYAAMLVVMLAMLAFVVDLAQTRVRTLHDATVADATAADGSEAPAPVLANASSGASVGARPSSARAASDPTNPADPFYPGGPVDDGMAAPVRRQWAGMGLSLFSLGTLLMLAAVVLRGLSVMRAPWGNMYEFLLTGTMVIALVFTILAMTRDLRWMGSFVSAVVLLMLGMCLVVYTDASQLMPALKSYWLVIHVSVAFVSTALFTIGAIAAALFLFKDASESLGVVPTKGLKGKLYAATPSAKALDRFSYSLHIASFPLWTFTLIAGAIWAENAWGRYWGWDPKEVWTFVIWVVYAAYLHARATTGWKIRSATWIALAGYACILINFFVVNKFFVGKHSYSGM